MVSDTADFGQQASRGDDGFRNIFRMSARLYVFQLRVIIEHEFPCKTTMRRAGVESVELINRNSTQPHDGFDGLVFRSEPKTWWVWCCPKLIRSYLVCCS